MKFLCIKCDEQMKYRESSTPPDGSMSITFVCQKCRNEVALLTNPGETQLLKSLDVTIGGNPPPHQPMETLRRSLARQQSPTISAQETTPDTGGPLWTKEAEERLAKAPAFIREMVRRGTEQFAVSRGYSEITVHVLDEAKQEIGPHSGA